MKKVTAVFMAIIIVLTNTQNIFAVSKENSKQSNVNVVITEEKINGGTLYKEYHNSKLVDTLTVYEKDELTEYSTNNTNLTRVDPYAVRNSVQGTKLGSVYYNVSGYSRQIRVDLGYANGSVRNTTYTIRNNYASLLSLGVDIAAALFMPEVFAVTTARKLISWGIVKATTEGIVRVSSSTLAARAQEQYIYAYAPYQAPDQAEISRTLLGTAYTITETNHKMDGQTFYSGSCKEMWGQSALGYNVGNLLFSNYFSVARWVRI